MPHVIVKLYPGRTEEQKIKLADEIVKDVVAIAKCDEKSVPVAFEEIEKEDWAKKVYKPDILEKKTASIKNQDIIHLNEAGYDGIFFIYLSAAHCITNLSTLPEL
jgi:4-oxalocrotonate tautomerase